MNKQKKTSVVYASLYAKQFKKAKRKIDTYTITIVKLKFNRQDKFSITKRLVD